MAHLWKVAFLYPMGWEFFLSALRDVSVHATKKYRLPVLSRTELSKVFRCSNVGMGVREGKNQIVLTHLGTMSLKSSIFILPAGVSPIWMSMKTTGRVVDDMVSVLGLI